MSTARHSYELIVDDIFRQIAAGELVPGAALPTGRELCDRYGVSRQTIATAMVVLRTLGLIVGQRGRGVYVTADHRAIATAAESSGRSTFAGLRDVGA
ncbi:winged helix-turn-helix domain-containing protein [Asanoa sp. NPDC049518]|uniref:winged helix-turn-helix domain-containing protein n=1 Tax=unclassified Asanoa TaxID=2685164 RepID=UPI0034388B5B